MIKPTFVVMRDPVIRVDGGESFTPGTLYYNGLFFGYTCEDEDRYLENGGVQKVYGKTAIPRGLYKLTTGLHSLHNRPPTMYVEINDVPNYSGVLIHGGNKAEDSLGCILLGRVRTKDGIAECADTVKTLLNLVIYQTKNGKDTYLEVK